MASRPFGKLVPALVLGSALTAPAPAVAQDAGSEVYRKVLKSTAWIHSPRGGGGMATGTGSLVDRGRRLVLTNYHVVGDVKRATVFFPAFERDGHAVADKKFYTSRGLGIPGDVVELDKAADLALVRVDRVPDAVPELPLAPRSADPGQQVHSIGNPGRSGALWVYTPGRVRQVYEKAWKAKLDGNNVVSFRATVVETDSATNPGDSGGPLVNDKGELVGVTEGGALDANLLSTFVDLSEVKKLLGRRSVQALRSTDARPAAAVAAKPPPRDKPVAGKDDGKFFGDDVWKQYQQAADELYKKKKADFVVETFATSPAGDAEKFKAMTPKERFDAFKDVAQERVKKERLSGLYVFVNRSPSFLYVEVTPDAEAKFPTGLRLKIQDALLASFKEKKFDDGLKAVTKLASEGDAAGGKK